jgi:MtrB/PioB family decaheme-associated outer membrane protein
MRKATELALLAVFTLLAFPMFSLAQGQDKENQIGSVEFGVRFATGDVYGRPDLPFAPSLKTSQFNEYQDVRNGFYVRHFDVKFDNVLHSKNYFSLQSQSTLYRDQSYLASFGNYGKFKLQFRYDEIPHIYSDTARTLFAETSSGIYSYPALIRQALQGPVPPGTSLPSIVSTQVVPQSAFITPQIIRKGGAFSGGYKFTPHWTTYGSFFRENQNGTRPIGLIMNSSPSASATSGYGVELPEPISYWTNLVRAGLEYGRGSFVVQGGYTGSFFDNNTHTLTWDNPFNLNLVGVSTPTTGRMALYPDNHANYLNFAAGADLTKYLHLTASINPGWLRQNQTFLPYTTNPAISTCGDGTQDCTSLAVLPEANLGGDVRTLAMNYNVSTATWKNLAAKVNFRYYDWSDNTSSTPLFTPVQGDASAPDLTAPDSHTPFGFTTKDLEATGFWYFATRSSLKAGYEALWMDRSHRDVAHSLENSFFFSGDWSPLRNLLLRVSYRHSDRKPDSYQDDNVTDAAGNSVTCTDTTTVFFTANQRCLRRFDEAARLQNRGDALLQYTPWDKLTFSAFGGTLQNNYTIAGGTNSPVPLNFLTGTAASTSLYYSYGLQKDISYNYGFDVDYAFSPQITLYAEYSREHYYTRMITRYRTPSDDITACAGCDTPNNDWESTTRDPVDVYSVGFDLYLSKKIYFTTYYTLSAGKGNVDSRFLGDPTVIAGANDFLLTGTNAATPYPETVDRSHEVGVIFKYKLTDHLTPKLEYRYQQWDNRDYQTSVMTPYMGCVSPIPNGPPVTNAVPGCTAPILSSNTPNPQPGAASPFYPGFVVGDPSAARYLFLGVDQPSYHAHTVMATLEYRF